MNTSKSETLFAAAQQVIPGGVDSPVCAFRSSAHTAADVQATLAAAQEIFDTLEPS